MGCGGGPTEKKKKAQTLEVDLIFCTRGKQVLEPAVVDGGSV